MLSQVYFNIRRNIKISIKFWIKEISYLSFFNPDLAKNLIEVKKLYLNNFLKSLILKKTAHKEWFERICVFLLNTHYLYKKQDIRMYVPSGRQNGWTEWADFFCGNTWVTWSWHTLKKFDYFETFIFSYCCSIFLLRATPGPSAIYKNTYYVSLVKITHRYNNIIRIMRFNEMRCIRINKQ